MALESWTLRVVAIVRVLLRSLAGEDRAVEVQSETSGGLLKQR